MLSGNEFHYLLFSRDELEDFRSDVVIYFHRVQGEIQAE